MNHAGFHSLDLEFSSNLLTCNKASQKFHHFVLCPKVKRRYIKIYEKVNRLYFNIPRVKFLVTNILPPENIETKYQPPFRKLQRRHPQ